MQKVMPGVKRGYCVMHLWRNFSKQWKDKELRSLAWKCAQSATKSEFNVSIEVVKRKNENAWADLDKWPCESWTKAYFSENYKVNNITNNNCESFNAKILKFRNMPILSLCEDIRTYIVCKITSAKLKMTAVLGPLVPMQ